MKNNPRIAFFSGGSALKDFCSELKKYTTQSVHIITVYDSGGSSAELRRYFDMPSIGDLRNRMLALQELKSENDNKINELLNYRLSQTGEFLELIAKIDRIITNKDWLIKDVDDKRIDDIRFYLKTFRENIDQDFDLRNASLGNLVITGIYLYEAGDLMEAIRIFGELLNIKGKVIPVSKHNLNLVAVLQNGRVIDAQHKLTGKVKKPINSPVKGIFLADKNGIPKKVSASNKAIEQIEKADLICYPMGSFYSSVLVNLKHERISQAIKKNPSPKIYIPNLFKDPELWGKTINQTVNEILRTLRCGKNEVSKCLNAMILHEDTNKYHQKIKLKAIEELGIKMIKTKLIDSELTNKFNNKNLLRTLKSLI